MPGLTVARNNLIPHRVHLGGNQLMHYVGRDSALRSAKARFHRDKLDGDVQTTGSDLFLLSVGLRPHLTDLGNAVGWGVKTTSVAR